MERSRPLRILALSGSLRAASTNTALLEAARVLAPNNVNITLFTGIGQLPHFSPDVDKPEQPVPDAVAALRAAVAGSDGLLVASPEYAHGIPGAFKNALDWLVSGPEFPGKPIAFAHATPRGSHARASLREVLATMSGTIIDEASFTVPLMGSAWAPAAILDRSDWAAEIRRGVEVFAATIRQLRLSRPDSL